MEYLWQHVAYRSVLIAYLAGTTLVCVQWLLSWLDKPMSATPRQQRYLDSWRVIVSVPVKNEDPAILDRTLWALVNQTRPLDLIEVVDNGSEVDYQALRDYWSSLGISWITMGPLGKKGAQAVTFARADADIFVTVDSDSALAANAIERGLIPFTDPRVMSVAGMELAYNYRRNWLTWSVYARTLFFQIVACGAQSVLGDVLVNRGPFALYRAAVCRNTIPAYLEETFPGVPCVHLGDDAALTLFSRGRGRAVQQSDAFAFSMFPETLGHHLRQWTRWMRGSTIRNCWRVRYLRPGTYGWIFTVISVYLFLVACAVPFVIWGTWPQSAGVLEWVLAAVMPWAWLSGVRILTVRRSDQGTLLRWLTLVFYPVSIIWLLAVLRWIRLWGIATYWVQGWNTRQDGAETLSTPELEEARI